jgi:hypothetical protein
MQDTGQDPSRDSAQDVSEGRWLTYAELAQLRGIDRASAFKLVLRHKWRRQKNNQGQVIALVPSDFSDQRDASRDNGYDASHAFETALAAIRETHAGEVQALREQLEMVKAQADLSRDAVLRAETTIAGERQQVEALRERLDAANAEARDALQAADDLRRRESAWWQQGRWARLRAAWRGE